MGNLLDYRVDLGITVQIPGILSVFEMAAMGPPSANMRMRNMLGHLPDLLTARRMAAVLPPSRSQVSPQVSPQIPAIRDARDEERRSRL